MNPGRKLLRSWRFYGAAHTTRHVWRALYYRWLRSTGRPTARRQIHNYYMDLSLRVGGISRELYVYGEREADLRYILDCKLRPGAVMIDVGANLGYYALYAACRVGPAGRVIALEPDPRNLELLRANITLNGLDNLIEVLPEALSERSGQMEFYLHKYSNLSALRTTGEAPDEVSILVQVEAAGDLLRRYAPVDLVRMDIEGHEVLILDALATSASADPNVLPAAVAMEVHPERYGPDRLDMGATLQRWFALGYKAELASCMLDRFPGVMQLLGYTPFAILRSDYHNLGLFTSLQSADTQRAVCELGCIRHLLLSRRSPAG